MGNLTYNEIANSACDAIEILVNNALNNAKFDTTIIGIISAVVDEAVGEYKIKVQDATYRATATDPKTKLKVGDEVYILVPQNDFSKPKKIIGSVKTLGTTFLDSQSTHSRYQIIGNNPIAEVSNKLENYFSYCSYDSYNGNAILDVLYDVDRDESENKLTIDETAFYEYMQHAKYIQFTVDVKTLIPINQRYTGNFGIIFEIEYRDKTNEQVPIVRTYLFDSDSMTGTTHNLSSFLTQKMIQETDGTDYIRIKRIYAFVKDFTDNPGEVSFKPNDIFFNNISVFAMTDMDDVAWNSYYLKLDTSKGATLTTASRKTTINADLLFQNRKIADDKVQYYWFLQNGAITLSSEHYCPHGGQGWYCLNTKENQEWIPATCSYEVNDTTMVANSAVYKCVAIYEYQVVSQEITIYNKNPLYDLRMLSSIKSNGFILNSGMMDLQCDVAMASSDAVVNSNNFNFYWSRTNGAGNYEALDYENAGAAQVSSKFTNRELYLTLISLKDYIANRVKEKLLSLTERYSYFKFNEVSSPEDETTFPFEGKMSEINKLVTNNDKSIQTIKDFQEALIAYMGSAPISYIDKNLFHKLSAKTIDRTATISCAVFRKNENEEDDIYVGTVSKEIKNMVSGNLAKYSLNLINKNQMFKYSSEGLSPAHHNNKTLQPLKTLSFTIFNEAGNEIDPNKVNQLSVTWKIPIKNSMVTPKLEEGITLASLKTDDFNEYYLIENQNTLSFNINSTYNYQDSNNDIILEVIYDNVYLREATNFSFLKDGVNGTNGTNYYCRIIPEQGIEGYPTLYSRYDSSGQFHLTSNFAGNLDTDVAEALLSYFTVEFWGPSQQIQPDRVAWKILTGPRSMRGYSPIHFISALDIKQEFDTTETENDSFNVKIDTDVLQDIVNEEKYPALTLQAIVTYQSTKYYATLPLAWVHFTEPLDILKHHIEIKPSTGFNEAMYSADAQNPQYNSTYPFEIMVSKREIGTVVNNSEDGEGNGNTDNDEENTVADEVLFYETDITTFAGDDVNFGTPFTYKWNVYGHCANSIIYGENGEWIAPNEWLLSLKQVYAKSDDGTDVLVPHKAEGIPPTTYDGLSVNNGVSCKIYYHNSDKPNAVMFFPIHFYLNRYGLSHLNDWDGNSIKINEEEGYILTPQIGAGRKESDNSFTGMIMGEVKGGTKEGSGKVGLIGYGDGVQTLFLDAETGSAYFGKGGEISIEPNDGDTQVKLGVWNLDTNAIWRGSNIYAASGNNIYLGQEGFSLGDRLQFNTTDNKLVINGQIKISDIRESIGAIGGDESQDSSIEDNVQENEGDEEGGITSGGSTTTDDENTGTGGSATSIKAYDAYRLQVYTKNYYDNSSNLKNEMGTYTMPNFIGFRETEYPSDSTTSSNSKYDFAYMYYVPGANTSDGYREPYTANGTKYNKIVNHIYFNRGICIPSLRIGYPGTRIIAYDYQKEGSADGHYLKDSTSCTYYFGPSRTDCAAKYENSKHTPRRVFLRGDRVLVEAYGEQNRNKDSKVKYNGNYVIFAGRTRMFNYGSLGPYTNRSWTTKSDERLKNLQPLDDRYYDFFTKLKPYAYTWKYEETNPVKSIGYSAQQVKQALFDSGLELNDFAGLTIDYNNEDGLTHGINDLHTLSYEEFGPIYALALQKALKKIDELEERVKQLEK